MDFTCVAGEVHALVGQNGAGKSTLMNLLAGVFPPSHGRILLDGEPVTFRHPLEARRAGIRTVYQTPDLVPHLSVVENIFLGEEPSSALGFLSLRRQRRLGQLLSDGFGLDLPLEASVATLSPSQRHLVTIARALVGRAERGSLPEPRILILDEPTAALSPSEADHLFALMRRLTAEGTGIIYISHRLQEVLDLSDRVSILRDGQLVSSAAAADLTRDAIVRAMTGGHDVGVRTRSAEHRVREAELLSIRGLVADGLGPFDLTVHAGEVVGIAGLVGSGRSEFLRLVYGADPPTAGRVSVAGAALRPGDPFAAMRAGLGFLGEDRRADGLANNLAVKANLTMTRLGDLREEPSIAASAIQRLSIRGKPEQPVYQLSGGNQQKVALGKWLKDDVLLLLVDEPTQGVDVGAKDDIHAQLLALAAHGIGILLVSSDFPELALLSDRVIVMRQGRFVAEMQAGDVSEELIISAALG